MIQTHQMVMDTLSTYGSPKAKLTRMVSNGEMIRIRRGLYIDDLSIPRMALAPVIYGPSYISFNTALSWHGLIPERVEIIESASFGKNRDKTFHTPLGEYHYRYLPASAYPHGLRLQEDSGYQFLIASREKALCDAMYKAGVLAHEKDIEALLIENWRIEMEDIESLDKNLVRFLAPLYRKKALTVFASWLEKESHP
ncbi:MAG TPA: hypothetical protein PKH81_00820 [Treponemataceae bacterium]|nr:hypothetical protein [Treponemataceae bacterium]